jgi:hypothetical protein
MEAYLVAGENCCCYCRSTTLSGTFETLSEPTPVSIILIKSTMAVTMATLVLKETPSEVPWLNKVAIVQHF